MIHDLSKLCRGVFKTKMVTTTICPFHENQSPRTPFWLCHYPWMATSGSHNVSLRCKKPWLAQGCQTCTSIRHVILVKMHPLVHQLIISTQVVLCPIAKKVLTSLLLKHIHPWIVLPNQFLIVMMSKPQLRPSPPQ